MKLHVPVAWFAGGWIACCLAFPCAVRAQADNDGERLKNASNEVVESTRYDGMTVITHPSTEDLEKGFAGWARNYPQRFTFETRGKTPQGRPILMGRITDSAVPDTDKQVALFTSCHGAKELSAATGLLRLMKYLLSDDPEAAEIRKRQVVLVVPYTDPDHIALGQLKQTRLIYNGKIAGGGQLWTVNGVTQPQKYPYDHGHHERSRRLAAEGEFHRQISGSGSRIKSSTPSFSPHSSFRRFGRVGRRSRRSCRQGHYPRAPEGDAQVDPTDIRPAGTCTDFAEQPNKSE